MNDYYDTGVLLKLVIQEPESPAVITFVQTRAAPLPLHPLLEYEAKNALRAKRFRKEITARELRESLREMDEYIRLGRFERITLDLLKALDEAERLSAKITPATGCRAIDLLHISIARQLSCQNFVSLDVRQLRAAQAAGFRIVNPCKP